MRYRKRVREFLGEVDRQKQLFDSMLAEVEKQDPKSAYMLSTMGASEPMLVLGKYFVEGKRVTGVVGDGT